MSARRPPRRPATAYQAEPAAALRGELARRRASLFGAAAAVAIADLGAKAWARSSLPAAGLDGWVVDLRLASNTGVAFSLGSHAPAPVIVAVTALITAAIGIACWRGARLASRLHLAGLGAILGGATANLADRAVDGAVTDYLHTGWWPTFNLADVAICTGACLLVLATFNAPPATPDRTVPSGEGRDASP
ncbi:signal peptidase II [Quadrisphaera granulorum]|uniref:Lipoprotein signal peptidase n=1 Tax=Quadrisphaera granulorum TaxID=317664 RepID=A0A316A6A4_9ACTN|nr:signal peptidase II [Quadrisphaera granulorum]PWJ53215.1 signal peptidase II [Quadrisphaera granulorum]SZE97147.1 signal peptidase II [Quadrisphaera granulorum]